jgi:hypothetical protein
MSRYVNDFLSTKNPNDIIFIYEDFFNKEGFKLTNYNNETVWKKGIGLLAAPQYIKLETYENNIHIEAWLKFALLPGIYIGEMDLSGAFAFAIKKLFKAKVEILENLLI